MTTPAPVSTSSPARPSELDVLSSADAAVLLGVDRTTVNRWAASGTLVSAVKAPGIRGARMFLRRDVEALAEARRNEEATA